MLKNSYKGVKKGVIFSFRYQSRSPYQ